MAWTVLGAAHKVSYPYMWMLESILILSFNCTQAILAQKDRDGSIDRLVETVNDMYSFVHEAEPLKKIQSHARIVSLMTSQTTECAYFIRDYAKNKSFCTSFFLQ